MKDRILRSFGILTRVFILSVLICDTSSIDASLLVIVIVMYTLLLDLRGYEVHTQKNDLANSAKSQQLIEFN